MYGSNLGVRDIKVTHDWTFGENQLYESVNVLGGAMRTNFVPQCIMEACRAGRFKFMLTFMHILSALFGFQIRRNLETHEFIIQL